MAFENKNLSVLAYANGFTLWHYTTIDDDVDFEIIGYFDEAAEGFRVGDMILTNALSDRGAVTSGILSVISNSQNVVKASKIMWSEK